jgi:pimeloyl-ACP methyl ester carboxylesterase
VALPPIPELPGVAHEFVDAGGVRIHVASAGSGEPLVLQHGWPECWYAWRRVIGPLSEHYRVICPDLRGHGWSEAPPRGYEKEQLARDLIAVLDALGLERVRLAGHDWGGFTGYLVCLRAPARIERYVAMGIPHPFQRPDPRRLLTLYRLWYQALIAAPLAGRVVLERFPQFVQGILRAASGRGGVFSEEELELYGALMSQPDHAAATVQVYRTFLTKELRLLAGGHYRAERLTVPTLHLIGERDPAGGPSTIPGYEDCADDMRHVVLEGVGHWTAEEAPERVAAELLDFFAGT